MKAKLVNDLTFEKVKKYLIRMDAPIYLRACPSAPEWYSIILRPGADYRVANLFTLDSTEMSPLDRACTMQKLWDIYSKDSFVYPFKSVATIFAHIKGKLL